jgi:predicted Fe-Mo cluster-binding NifX family protein
LIIKPNTKILIPLFSNQIAPRFDLATNVCIVIIEDNLFQQKTVVLPRSSAEELCYYILTEKIDTVICGGIEDEYFQYLIWKKVNVIDNVIGTCDQVAKRLRTDCPSSGEILNE